MININKYFKTYSKRTSKFLYSLGFNKTSFFDENKTEYWIYERSNALNDALDFYFKFRENNKKAGDIDNDERRIYKSKNNGD